MVDILIQLRSGEEYTDETKIIRNCKKVNGIYISPKGEHFGSSVIKEITHQMGSLPKEDK